MDPDVKKAALRMIPYGLYVLTGETPDGKVAAATVNWVTQASFEPPLIVVAVKADSGAHAVIEEAGAFALNVLGKGQSEVAVNFFKSAERKGDTVGGEAFHAGTIGAPILDNCRAAIECELLEIVRRGDHSIFVGEVVGTEVMKWPAGRPDDQTLVLKDLEGDIYYGG